jgi:hypothetical protein
LVIINIIQGAYAMKNLSANKLLQAIFTLTTACLILTLALAATTPQPAFAADTVKVFVNGKEISFPDAKPFIDENGRTQVPVRFVAEAMNGKVDWDPNTRTVRIERGRVTLSMTIGVKEIVVLGAKKPMDTAPLIQESRTFVPLRFVSEGFGSKVEWESATRTVRINDSGGDKYQIGDFIIDIGENDSAGVGLASGGDIVIHKESGLIMGGGDLGNGNSVLELEIQVDNPQTDIPRQRQEVEAILKQCLSEKMVGEIMAYAAQKRDLFDKLEHKEFKEGRYEVIILGGVGPIMITVYMR